MSDINTSKKIKSEGINLFISYLLLIIATITAIILLGCQFGHNKKDEEYTFYSPQEVDEYLMSHKQIHLIAPNSFASNESDDFLDWIWNKNNCSIQNICNANLWYYNRAWNEDPSLYTSISIKINNSLFVTLNRGGNEQHAEIEKQGRDGNLIIKGWTFSTPITRDISRNNIIGAYTFAGDAMWRTKFWIDDSILYFPMLVVFDYPNLINSFINYYPGDY